ncbi:hypothetical protein GGR51DRAFT_551567 [Nemania sp. FL0031]|nr:hypothetical protein GGR51DRAFT_551567 [Nemania sp. FL0031]
MNESSAETGVGAAIAVAAIISVGLRFYTRYYKRAGFKSDDWLILGSLILLVLTDILVIYSNSINPNGAYVASTTGIEYSPEDVLYTKISFIATVLYFSLTSTTKLSILLLYNRLFSVHAAFRRQIIALCIAVICYGVGTTIANLLSCIPLKYTWINNLEDPRFCFNYNVFWFATGIAEAALDIFIFIMPIRVVTQLHLHRRKRIAVGSVFLVGIFVIVSGLLKAVYGYAPGSRNPSFSKTALWTTVHSGTGIICACLPVFWALLVRLANFRDWAWLRNLSRREKWRNFSSWSRLRPEPGSLRNDSAVAAGNRGPAVGGEYELPLRSTTAAPLEERYNI